MTTEEKFNLARNRHSELIDLAVRLAAEEDHADQSANDWLVQTTILRADLRFAESKVTEYLDARDKLRAARLIVIKERGHA